MEEFEIDLINLAQQMGYEMQKSNTYINFNISKQNMELDEDLQELIKNFNLSKNNINYEISKENPDQEKINKINKLLSEKYNKISENENMKAFNNSKQELDNLTKKIISIITLSTEGHDPFSIDYNNSCGESCSSCSGCC